MSLAFRPTPNTKDQVFVFMSPSDRVTQLAPGHQNPFSSPSTTLRATVGVLQPISTNPPPPNKLIFVHV
jgi:hypothetical protein